MDFLKLCEDRYSMRKFDGRPLDDAHIDKILEAARLAPTAKNLQPQRIFVLKSEEALEKLGESTSCTFGTKTAFFICYNKNESWKSDFDGKDSGYVDSAIVLTHMTLAATSLGIGSTIVMWYDCEKLKASLGLPENLEPVCVLVTGDPHPDAHPSRLHTIRKEKEQFTDFI